MCGHPCAPKLSWSESKLPFEKWSARHPDGRDFLAEEISGVLYLRFKSCAIFRHKKNSFDFTYIVCLNRGPKYCMVVEFRRTEVQSVELIGATVRKNYVTKG